MADKVVQLVDKNSNNLYPVAGAAITNAISTGAISSQAVTSAKIANGNVTGVANNATVVGNTQLALDTVGTPNLRDQSVTSDKIDWTTLVPYAICNRVPVSPDKLLSDYKDQGIYMINYTPADTPATDLVGHVGTLLVLNAWHQTQGVAPRYITQMYIIRNDTNMSQNYHRFYVRNGTQKSDGTYLWDAIGWIRIY